MQQDPSPQTAYDAPSASDRLCDVSLRRVCRYRWPLFIAIFVLYLLGFNGQWRVERDSAMYLTVGRNLAEGKGYSYHGRPNHLIFPGLPYLVSGTFSLTHSESTLPALIIMFASGWIAILLVYRLFYLFGGDGTGIVVASGVALTRVFYRYCFELLTDLPFLVGTLAFLAGYEAIFVRPYRSRKDAEELWNGHQSARWYDYALLIGGLAVAMSMRIVFWGLLGAFGLSFVGLMARERRKHVIGVTVAILAMAALFFFLNPRLHSQHAGPAVEDYEGTFLAMLHKPGELMHQVRANIDELCDAALVKAMFGCSLFHWLNWCIAIVAIGIAIGLVWKRLLWGLLVIFTIMMVLVFQPLDRYLLPVIPLLVFAWWRLLVWLNRRLPVIPGNLIFVALFLTGLSTNIARIVDMIVEQRRVPFLQHFHDGRYASIDQIGQWIASNSKPDDWILVGFFRGRVLTFKAGRNVFEPTERLPGDFPKSRVFLLTGPSWADGHEGRHKDRSRDEADGDRDRVAEWLEVMHMRRGQIVAGAMRGQFDREPWTLYRVEPKP